MRSLLPARFALAWLLPLAVAAAAWRSPWVAWGTMAGIQLGLALVERLPGARHSPPAEPAPRSWYRVCLRLHVPLQAALLVLGAVLAHRHGGVGAAIALGIAVGGVTGSQGITFAHELGHSRSRLDRLLAWALMGSVLYAHFMIEHYRGHHVRAATPGDPATARAGESLWRFLPRTLAGSWRSAWALEARWLAQRRLGWWRSPLARATALQALLLAAVAAASPWALLFWVVQAAYAVFLLETVNYIEHYGLTRGATGGGRYEPFGERHAWNADSPLTNCLIANLQRHSDHHMHAWKPYETLQALPGPQLPTGYAGCLFLASVPPLWFRVMHPRLAAWTAGAGMRNAMPAA